jgi:hypothetical protein
MEIISNSLSGSGHGLLMPISAITRLNDIALCLWETIALSLTFGWSK